MLKFSPCLAADGLELSLSVPLFLLNYNLFAGSLKS